MRCILKASPLLLLNVSVKVEERPLLVSSGANVLAPTCKHLYFVKPICQSFISSAYVIILTIQASFGVHQVALKQLASNRANVPNNQYITAITTKHTKRAKYNVEIILG
jgi:hypothetical protein